MASFRMFSWTSPSLFAVLSLSTAYWYSDWFKMVAGPHLDQSEHVLDGVSARIEIRMYRGVCTEMRIVGKCIVPAL